MKFIFTEFIADVAVSELNAALDTSKIRFWWIAFQNWGTFKQTTEMFRRII